MSDCVASFLQEICNTDRYGGRAVRLGNGRWDLYDVGQWTEAQTEALKSRFPSIECRVVSSRQSLSGFCVVLRKHRVQHVWASVLVCAVMVTVLVAVAVFFMYV